MRINENNYVDKAEEAIKSLVEESKQKCRGKVNIVTTSKIRNLLAMTADIYNQVLTYTQKNWMMKFVEELSISEFVSYMNVVGSQK